jgi:hypothetical protein
MHVPLSQAALTLQADPGPAGSTTTKSTFCSLTVPLELLAERETVCLPTFS